MDPSQLQGIVRIEVPQHSRGTGFIVRISGGVTEILTALHVVADLKMSRATGKPAWLAQSAKLRFVAEPGFQAPTGIDPILELGGEPPLDPMADWVLLPYSGQLPTTAKALPLAALEDRTEPRAWETFGFSDVAPDQGELHSGKIELAHNGEIHLFSRQAAAGEGGRLNGLSGAPCVTEGHVVGLVQQTMQEDGRTLHGAVLASDIQRIAERCLLPLASGPALFQAEMEHELNALSGSALRAVAQILGVPPMQSESALRIWTARALLLADEAILIKALSRYPKALGDLEAMVEMALARSIRAEAVARLQECLKKGKPRGLIALAKEALTARLLVARALGLFEVSRLHCRYVENPAATSEGWAQKVREALEAALGFGPGEIETEEELMRLLGKSGHGPVVIAFPFDVRSHPLDKIERYQHARALPMASSEVDFQREDYEIARPLDPATEPELLLTRRTVLRYVPQ